MRVERRGRVIRACSAVNRAVREEPVSEPRSDGRSFAISKRLVWEAWQRVKANRGAEGVDEETIQAFEANLRSFFDSLDHSLVLRAVAHHTDQRWILLYVERWLKAPLQLEDGTLRQRDRGSPQGSAISPVLANLFLHYALDRWLDRRFPGVP